MASTTIASWTLAGAWPTNYGASGYLGIYCTSDFVTDVGVEFLAGAGESLTGEFVIKAAISVAATVATVASLSLPKTDTSSPNNARYYGRIFKANGTPTNEYVFENFHLRESLGDSISYRQWWLDNQQVVRRALDTIPTTDEMNAAIDAAVDNAALNQDYVIGSYSSLAVAVAAMPATGATLVINQATTCTSSLSVPANVTLRFTHKGYVTVTTGVTLTIVGPVESPIHKIFYNATAALGTISFSGNKVLSGVWGEWWGAIGNGTTNDVAALQAACTALDSGAGGTLWLNGATYNIGSTLSVGSASAQHYINIQGIGPVTSILSYSGATNSIAVKLSNEKYTALKGVRINNAVAKGTTEGIRTTGPNVGTNTTGLVVERVIIDGFHIGHHTSDGGTNTSSEISGIGYVIQSCDIGLLNDSPNALNINVLNFALSLNTIGLNVTAGLVNLFGGTMTANTTDVEASSDVALYSVRTEDTVGTSLTLSSGAGTSSYTVIGCTLGIGASTPNAHTMISVTGGKLTIIESKVGGQIIVPGEGSSAISIIDTHVIDGTNTYTATATPDNMGPGFRITANTGGGGAQIFVKGVTQCDGSFNSPLGLWPAGNGFLTVSASGQGICFMQGKAGSAVASATAIIPSGSVFHVTGVTSITSITSTSFTAGQEITIIFDGILTFTDGGNLRLAGNFVTSADDTITLKWDGSAWYELGRSVN